MFFGSLLAEPSWAAAREAPGVAEAELRGLEARYAARIEAIRDLPAPHPFGVPRQAAQGVLNEGGTTTEDGGDGEASMSGSGMAVGDSGVFLSSPSSILEAGSSVDVSSGAVAPVAATGPAPTGDVSMTLDD
jgi:hypothetical protein